MVRYIAVFRVDCDPLDRIVGNYNIEEYVLRPCVQNIVPKEYSGVCSSFLLLFPFEGISDEEEKSRFRNRNIASRKAKIFIAWFVTASRTWARLTSRSFGPAMIGTRHTSAFFKEENFNDILLEDWGIDRQAKTGEFEAIQRPEVLERGRIAGEPFKLPSDFPELTKKLFNLDNDLRERFLNACFSYQFALENWAAYPTISILALVSSVESIMEGEPTSQFCEDAGKYCSQKRNVMKNFRMFFKRTLVNPLPVDLKKFLERIYGKRSKYVHKALLDGYGIRGIYHSKFTREMLEADAELRSLERLVNAALIEWLIKIPARAKS